MSNSNQEMIEARLAGYVDGELEDAGERQEIEQHLAENPQYRQVLDDLMRQRDLLRGLPREGAPAELSEMFHGHLERSFLLDGSPADDQRTRMRIPTVHRLLAVAAILFLTTGLAIIVAYVLPGRGAKPVALAPVNLPSPDPADGDNPTSKKDETAADAIRQAPEPEAAAAPAPFSPSVAMLDARGAAGGGTDKAVAGPGEELRLATKGMAQNQGVSSSRGSLAREAELNELAKNLSQDPHIYEMLGRQVQGNAVAATQPTSSPAAVVLFVRSGDIQKIQRQLDEFANDSGIAVQAAPRSVELALNTALSQRGNEIAQDGVARKSLGIDPGSVEGFRRNVLREKEALPGAPANAPTTSPADSDALMPEVAVKRVLPSEQNSKGGEAMAKSAAAPPAANGVSGKDVLASDDRVAEPAQGNFAPNLAPISSLYVVKRLDSRQIRELSDQLMGGAQVSQARIELKSPPSLDGGNLGSVADSALAENVAPSAAPGAPPAAAAPKARTERQLQANAARLDDAPAEGVANEQRQRASAGAPKPQGLFGAGVPAPGTPKATDGEADAIDVIIVVQSAGSAKNELITEQAPATQPAIPATQPSDQNVDVPTVPGK